MTQNAVKQNGHMMSSKAVVRSSYSQNKCALSITSHPLSPVRTSELERGGVITGGSVCKHREVCVQGDTLQSCSSANVTQSCVQCVGMN